MAQYEVAFNKFGLRHAAVGLHQGLQPRGDGDGDTSSSRQPIARLLDGLALSAPFTEQEAEDARQFLIGIAPLANETSADIVNQGSTLAGSGLGPDYLNEHFADLAAVTAEQATAAFREVIDPAQLTIAVTGAAADLMPALEGLGLEVSLRPAP